MGKLALKFALILTFLALTAFSYERLSEELHGDQNDAKQLEEVLYLPSGRGLSFISFGYRNALAQYLWFNTISYFGKHYRKDQNYTWLEHMCDLVTSLNPEPKHTYIFCSAMLAWEANRVDAATKLLSRAIETHPNDWYFYYLRGFNFTYFYKDQIKAKSDFLTASKLPVTDVLVTRLAAKTISELESPQTAIEFLQQALAHAADPAEQASLAGKLAKMKSHYGDR